MRAYTESDNVPADECENEGRLGEVEFAAVAESISNGFLSQSVSQRSGKKKQKQSQDEVFCDNAEQPAQKGKNKKAGVSRKWGKPRQERGEADSNSKYLAKKGKVVVGCWGRNGWIVTWGKRGHAVR